MLAPVCRERPAHVDLISRELTISVSADVALVAWVRLDEFALSGWHATTPPCN
jgi:hypothetical protein